MRFALEVTYRPGNTNRHTNLDVPDMVEGLNAFVNDLITLGGEGVKEITVKLEDPPVEGTCEEVPH